MDTALNTRAVGLSRHRKREREEREEAAEKAYFERTERVQRSVVEALEENDEHCVFWRADEMTPKAFQWLCERFEVAELFSEKDEDFPSLYVIR